MILLCDFEEDNYSYSKLPQCVYTIVFHSNLDPSKFSTQACMNLAEADQQVIELRLAQVCTLLMPSYGSKMV